MRMPFALIIFLFLTLCAGCSYSKPSKEELMFKGKLGPEMAQAIKEGDLTKTKELIRQGADVNAIGSKHRSLLYWALAHNRPKEFKLLLEHGADPTIYTTAGSTVIHFAAIVRVPIFLKILLRHGAPVDIEKRGGATPLFDALMGPEENVDALIKAGADINHADKFGDTPLHIAAAPGHYQDVLKFLHLGADPKAVNGQDATFQDYLAIRPNDDLLSDKAKKQLEEIRQFLRDRNIKVKF